MVRRGSRVRVPRDQAPGYESAAVQFHRAAELAQEFEYWNAADVLYGHAATAFADAVAIARRGEKSAGDRHLDVLALFEEAAALVNSLGDAKGHLRRIIDEKNRVSYTGDSFRRRELERLAKHAARFRDFAERVLRGSGARQAIPSKYDPSASERT